MRLLAAAVILATASSATPQTVADALRSGSKPISAADLPDSYRAVSLGAGGGEFSSLVMMGMGMASMGERSETDPRSKMLFGLFSSTFVDPDEFAALLDGKRPRIRAYTMDLSAMIAASGRSTQTPNPIFVETWIEAGRVVQWSPRPDVTKAAILQAFGREGSDNPSQGLSNVKQVALGIIMYANDDDDLLPYARSTTEAQTKIAPYLRNNDLWKSPNGGRILYNTALSGVSMTAIERPDQTLLVWEEKAYPDGKRAVGYTDGHAKRVDEPEWNMVWATEQIRRQNARPAKAVPARPSRPTGARRPR